MIPILKDKPSFASQLMESGMGTGREFGKALLGEHLSNKQKRSEAEAIKKMTGMDVSGLSPEVTNEFMKAFAKESGKQPFRDKMIAEIRNRYQQNQGNFSPNQEQINQKFIEIVRQAENEENRHLDESELNEIWNHLDKPQRQSTQSRQDPLSKIQEHQRMAEEYAAIGEHDLSNVEMNNAKMAMEEYKLREKGKIEERREAHGLAKPVLERGMQLVQELPYKENALMGMKDSTKSGNLGMFTLDNLAEITGLEGLRTPEGAAFKTESKEFFLGNLKRIGAKGLNQMMERVVQEMGPLIGRSTEANLSVIEVLEAENDVTRKEAELIDDISQSYKKEHGHYPENLQHQVYKELRPYAKARQEEALRNINKIKSLYSPKNKEGVLMYDPSGNLRRVPHENRKDAIKEGYRVP